jgi:hypothetical protein
MPYIKAKEKKELLELLDDLSKDYLWKEFERPCNSWGCCTPHYEDYVMLNKNWKKKAKRLKRLLK